MDCARSPWWATGFHAAWAVTRVEQFLFCFFNTPADPEHA